MLSNKERSIWILITLIGIIVTYFVTKNSLASFDSNVDINTTSSPTITSLVTIGITPVPCSLYSQLASEIEMQANEWFISENTQALSRDHYNPTAIWDWICEQYQEAFITNESWLNDPMEMAMRSRGYPVFENSGPNSVTAIFGKSSHMAIVILTYTNLPDDSIKDQEWRIDLVESSKKVWNIQWIGYRQHCRRTGSDEWVAERCL